MNDHRRVAWQCLLVGFLVLLATGCAQNPVSGTPDFVLMSEDQELELGRDSHAQIIERYGEYDDPALQAYVQQVGERLGRASHRPDLIYRFSVLDSADVNAFALPGGYIYITRGMLAYLGSEAELAAVLGHEIGHVTARHSVRQYTAHQAAGIGALLGAILVPQLGTAAAQDVFGLLGNALLSGYGRDHELEADRLGAEYIARNGYDPSAVLDVLGILKNQETVELKRAQAEDRRPQVYHGVFASHPDSDTRLREAVLASRPLLDDAGARHVGKQVWLDAIDGLAYGPSAREGVLRGRHFYHRSLDFGLSFPQGWRVDNFPDRLSAQSPDNEALLEVTMEDLNRRISPASFIRERLKIDLSAGESLSANGLPAYTGVAQTNTPFGRRNARFTIVYQHERAYIFAAATRSAARERYDEAFLSTALSLHSLTPDERRLARELRLVIVVADGETGFAELARQSGITNYREETLRLLNGYFPDGEPPSGERIKVVY